MSRVRPTAALVLLALGCAGPDPAEPKARPFQPSEDAGAGPAKTEDDDGAVVLVSAGGDPRRVHGYAPVARSQTVVRSELAFYRRPSLESTA